MSQITEAQLRRAIRDQIIRTLSEGDESKAETRSPLSKVLWRACYEFMQNAPEVEGNSPKAELGESNGKVAFLMSGSRDRKGRQYPLVQKRSYDASAPAFESEDALREAMISAARAAFSEFDMEDYFASVAFKPIEKTELKSGLMGYKLETSIPVRAKKREE